MIGILASSGSLAGSWTAGAHAAAEAANRSGGAGGRRVVVRELRDSDPWRSGAAAVARLLAEPGLAALAGAPDGVSAHVAVQAATRRRVPAVVLSPEESLTEAGDPWVFRAVPDDREQARALLAREGARGRRVLAVVPAGREGRERLKSLEKACAEAGAVLVQEPSAAEIVLLWLDPQEARLWLERSAPPRRPRRILASHRLDDPAFLEQPPAAAEGLVLPMVSARDAAYESVSAIVAAAREKGPSPAQVRAGLSRRFGPKGERVGTFPVGALLRGRLTRQ